MKTFGEILKENFDDDYESVICSNCNCVCELYEVELENGKYICHLCKDTRGNARTVGRFREGYFDNKGADALKKNFFDKQKKHYSEKPFDNWNDSDIDDWVKTVMMRGTTDHGRSYSDDRWGDTRLSPKLSPKDSFRTAHWIPVINRMKKLDYSTEEVCDVIKRAYIGVNDQQIKTIVKGDF